MYMKVNVAGIEKYVLQGRNNPKMIRMMKEGWRAKKKKKKKKKKNEEEEEEEEEL